MNTVPQGSAVFHFFFSYHPLAAFEKLASKKAASFACPQLACQIPAVQQ
jgi:hypothetical protein